MRGPRTSESNLRPWHGRVEHYTPDGPLGRLVLAAAVGSVGGTALFLAVVSVVDAFAFWPVLALLGSGLGLAGVALALVVLWPVYLSLIGNVESASAYPADEGVRPADSAVETDDAVAVLKRRYAAGEISEAEFERRLDDLLDADAVLDSSARPRGDGREIERN